VTEEAGTAREQLRMRLATHADVPALERLIDRSARELGIRDYSPGQIDGALRGAFGVDTQLIADRTYFVVELDGPLVGCGGWSRRATLFGADSLGGRDSQLLDPARHPARIRAFFVHPDFARRGIGRLILRRCEAEAASAGFESMELMATLTGVQFYSAHGYSSGPPLEHPLAGGERLRLVPMRKRLA
jgi:GNAT superfamily N-acetyltransferase